MIFVSGCFRWVSIRAPAWGATHLRLQKIRRLVVSIRAPAWGATFDFQRQPAVHEVSIRAPAWGATRLPPACTRARKFQFALPRGERRTTYKQTKDYVLFQFALPRGERRGYFASLIVDAGFQFALPRGERREGDDAFRARIRVSIRAPAWGATIHDVRKLSIHRVSIRAPAWEATDVVATLAHTA